MCEEKPTSVSGNADDDEPVNKNQWKKKENIENSDNTDRTTEQWERMIHILYYDIDLQ